MVIKVGINGFGRIGRIIFRTCCQNPEIEISAINDPAIDVEYICYLIKFDSTHGKFRGNVTHTDDEITVNDHTIKVFRVQLPPKVPWHRAGVQYVIEASGMFTCMEKASGHLASSGVKRVIVTAPSADVPMVILGVNDNKLNAGQKVLSCASSTLYCLAPMIKLLHDNFGVAEGFITSIHAMTPSLKPLDGLCLRGRHWRDHRSIHQNIIPASTGACRALGKIIPDVKDKLTGLAFRVPIVNVSVLDITIRLDSNTSLQDIIKLVDKASKSNFQNIIKISNDHAVSSDFCGDSHSCILDADSSLQLKPNFYKIICWYENEYSYACRVLDSIFFSEKQISYSIPLESKVTYVRSKFTRKQDSIEKEQISFELKDKAFDTICASCPNNEAVKVSIRKPQSLNDAEILSSPHFNSKIKKRNELFKVWNDECETSKAFTRQNRGSFFHSCIGSVPKNFDKSDCIKAQQRLENVKKEFSKMVNITEDLLRKSYSSKIVVEGNHSKELVFAAVPNLTLQDNKSNNKLKDMNLQTNTPVLKECGDVGNKIVDDNKSNDAVKEESKSCGEGKSSKSGYNITVDLKYTAKQKSYRTIETQVLTLVGSETRPNVIETSTNDNKNNSISFHTSSADWNAIVSRTLDTLIDGISNKLVENIYNEPKDAELPLNNTKTKNKEEDTEQILKIVEPDQPCETNTCDTQTSQHKPPEEEKLEQFNQKEFARFIKSKNYNMQIIDEELRKRNIILVNSESNFNGTSVDSELTVERIDRNNNSRQVIDDFSSETIAIPEGLSRYCSPENIETSSNGNRKRRKQDIYDKLDSASGSDSNNSFDIKERKSQIIQIADLTISLENLSRLDKICRIIEISDELSDKLFSKLDNTSYNNKEKKWSFKDLCERLQLDEFCNEVFGKTIV